MKTSARPVAVDVTGGDRAPDVVLSAVQNLIRDDVEVCLVGPERLVGQYPSSLVAEDALGEHRDAFAVRRLANTPVRVAMRAMRSGAVGAVFSCGDSAAVVVAAVLELGVLPGVERPALASVLPSMSGGPLVLVDSGANVDCRASQMVGFARLGAAFCRTLGVTHPRVGVLSNGEERGKGNAVVREVVTAVAKTELRCVGHVEPHHAMRGACDVLVCDGFVGNVFLKSVEAGVETLLTLARRDLLTSRTGRVAAWLVQRRLRRLRERVAWQASGGAVLLGVDGVVVIGHGRSDAGAVEAGMVMAHRLAQEDLVSAMRAGCVGGEGP